MGTVPGTSAAFLVAAFKNRKENKATVSLTVAFFDKSRGQAMGTTVALLWERRACDRLVLLLSERRQRLDARGAARGQVGRERSDGPQQHDDNPVRRDVVRCDAEEQRAERPQEQQRTGDADCGADGYEREAAGDD